MKKIKYVLLFVICIIFTENVYANDIQKITMDIYVDNYGNAYIKEEWVANLSNGTEGYKPYYNLGNSEITNYKVSLNDKYFETINDWDVDASFIEKSYKAGINEINNGYELCFGISNYGLNTYKMEYTITNFVSKVQDADMIYWQLIPYELTEKPDYIYIKIYSDFKYDFNLPVWGYGNYGNYVYVTEDTGVIEYVVENGLSSDEYMTILVKFPKDTFNTTSILDENFEYYLDMANEGSKTYTDKKSVLDTVISIFFSLLPFLIVFIITIISIKNTKDKYGTKKLKFNKDKKKIKNDSYFRDLPCDKDIFKAYWISCQYGLVKKKTDFLGAILLKWIKNKNIENTIIKSKFLKKEERAIKLINSAGLSIIEIELFEMMRRASVDGVLESNEFVNWCKKNYNKILKWFNKVIDNVTMDYVNLGFIKEEKKTFGNIYQVNDTMYDIALQMSGLKKFLNDFSNIKDRESIEVILWEEYLMYAQIFGIAKKVANEFKKLYPDILTEEVYNDVIFIHSISYSGISAASTAKQKAESYSSGGGGFSSGGGGGGSFGGGGGGGFR